MAWNRQKYLEAVAWLRDQETAAEGRDKWLFAVVIFGAIVGFITLLATLG